jgi:putative transposase
MPAADLRDTGSRALRRGRMSATGQIYLVTFATCDRKCRFLEFEVASRACRAMTHEHVWRRSSLLAWVLMPDHWHGLIQVGHGDTLSRCVARTKAAATRDLGKGASHPVLRWQPGFHDRAMRREEDLRALARYVVLNPVRAGLVRSVWEYSYWDAVWIAAIVGDRR